jgi:hypothetical protein
VLVVTDLVSCRGHYDVELLFHLGPEVSALLDGHEAVLTWPTAGATRRAVLALPAEPDWTAHRGESDPPLGWYSPSFGRRVPSTTLVGAVRAHGTHRLRTELRFDGDVPLLPRGEAAQ